MIRNYLIVALRNISRNKVFSIINILGLAIGIASCILILLFVRSEWSYDRFHENADEIFRVAVFENYSEDQQFFNSITPIPLGPALKANFPEVRNAARILDRDVLVQFNNKSFAERIHISDPELFKIFDFPVIKGDVNTFLNEPNSVVITKSIAEKYFGSSDPMNKILAIKLTQEYQDFIITGVAEDVPVNSSIQFRFLIPFKKTEEIFNPQNMTSWTNIFCETYIHTDKSVNASQLEAKVPSLVKTIHGESFKPGVYNLRFQPLTNIHLDTGFPVGLEPISNPVYSYILSVIAVLVLIIASINFITLTIGRSSSRAAEVGIRKVIGAERSHLIKQFWGESLVIVLIAAVIAIVIAESLLPAFNNLSGKTLSLTYNTSTLLSLAGIVVIIGLIAGIYPAVILSAFKPVDVLKGKVKIKSRSLLRQVLVGGQFMVAIILITSTLIISSQLNYLKNKNLGFDKEHIIVVPTGISAKETLEVVDILRNELKQNKNILNVSASSNPVNDQWNFIGFGTLGGVYEKFYFNMVDYDFVKTFGIKLLSGRDFSKEYPNDAAEAVIVNESFIKSFNLKDLNEGKMPGNFNNNKIIGIVKDFHFESLHTEIKPAAMVINPSNLFKNASDVGMNLTPQVFIKIRPEEVYADLDFIKTKWESVIPQIPFEFTFLDENINSKYQSESRLVSIVTVSSIFAIFLTCLGVLGLTMLITARRTKEIGIRKVLGASVGAIMRLLTKEFALIILISNIAAFPLAYYAMHVWLQDFSYRISVSIWSFLFAGIIILLVSMATISSLVFRVANENPVNSLSYE